MSETSSARILRLQRVKKLTKKHAVRVAEKRGKAAMARIRTIKPEFWTHEQLSELSEATHILAAALLNYADDYGYFNANPGLIKAACSPLREPSVSIHGSLIALSNIGYLEFGNSPDGRRFGRVVKFDEHQRVNRPTASKIKDLPIAWEGSRKAHGIFTESSSLEQGTGNREQGTPIPDSDLSQAEVITWRAAS